MRQTHSKQRGFTMVEILVAIVILAIGLLAMAGLQSKLQTTEVESYQRAQAAMLVQDMVNRMLANMENVEQYVLGTQTLGTGTTGYSYYCYTNTAATYPVRDRDFCEWSNAIQGRYEWNWASGGGPQGWRSSLIEARGCIELVQAEDDSAGVCQPGIYRVSVAWQGLTEGRAPNAALSCGANLYGDEKYRRVMSTLVTTGLPRCT